LMQAYQKIKADEQLAEKAKRAMAIAITLLEEQTKTRINHEVDSEEQTEVGEYPTHGEQSEDDRLEQ
ncbi:MAG: hypothetical protein V1754_14545, partial [Pseudomonadota bacterium]